MAESLRLPPSHECVGDSALREKSGHTSMSASAVGQPQPSASASVLPSSSFSTPICQFLARTKSPQKNSHRRAVASSDVPRGTQSPRAPLTPDPAGIRWLNVPRGTPTRPKGSNSWPADGFDTPPSIHVPRGTLPVSHPHSWKIRLLCRFPGQVFHVPSFFFTVL